MADDLFKYLAVLQYIAITMAPRHRCRDFPNLRCLEVLAEGDREAGAGLQQYGRMASRMTVVAREWQRAYEALHSEVTRTPATQERHECKRERNCVAETRFGPSKWIGIYYGSSGSPQISDVRSALGIPPFTSVGSGAR